MTTSDPPRRPNTVPDSAGPTGRTKSVGEPGDWPGTPSSWRLRPLYGPFYGLSEPPFDLTPNPRFLFLSRRQREALSNLRYALATSKGFTLILGDAGTGKTTMVRTALAEIGDSPSRYVLVSNPTLDRSEFYEFLAREFGLSPEARVSKTQFLSELQHDVGARFAVGGLTGLIIDEAQSMPHELLEEIRLLGNIETATTKLLNIVLSGQPELAHRLNDPSLRQLKQRIALRCELRPLGMDETAAYISGRLRIAGGNPGEIFTRETVIAIHEASRGIPRTINVLCDNALIGGFAAQVKPIPLGVVEEVCRDFDLTGESPAGSSPDDELQPAPGGQDRSSAANTGEAAGAARGTLPATEPRMFSSISPERKRRFRFF
jgi:type II secretory pathway predicted ATPase ExeA